MYCSGDHSYEVRMRVLSSTRISTYAIRVSTGIYTSCMALPYFVQYVSDQFVY